MSVSDLTFPLPRSDGGPDGGGASPESGGPSLRPLPHRVPLHNQHAARQVPTRQVRTKAPCVRLSGSVGLGWGKGSGKVAGVMNFQVQAHVETDLERCLATYIVLMAMSTQ